MLKLMNLNESLKMIKCIHGKCKPMSINFWKIEVFIKFCYEDKNENQSITTSQKFSVQINVNFIDNSLNLGAYWSFLFTFLRFYFLEQL